MTETVDVTDYRWLYLTLFIAFNFVGLVAISMVALRLKILPAIGAGFVISIVWMFGYIVWPGELRGDSRYYGAFVVTLLVVFGLGALARFRHLKTHGR